MPENSDIFKIRKERKCFSWILYTAKLTSKYREYGQTCMNTQERAKYCSHAAFQGDLIWDNDISMWAWGRGRGEKASWRQRARVLHQSPQEWQKPPSQWPSWPDPSRTACHDRLPKARNARLFGVKGTTMGQSICSYALSVKSPLFLSRVTLKKKNQYGR